MADDESILGDEEHGMGDSTAERSLSSNDRLFAAKTSVVDSEVFGIDGVEDMTPNSNAWGGDGSVDVESSHDQDSGAKLLPDWRVDELAVAEALASMFPDDLNNTWMTAADEAPPPPQSFLPVPLVLPIALVCPQQHPPSLWVAASAPHPIKRVARMAASALMLAKATLLRN